MTSTYFYNVFSIDIEASVLEFNNKIISDLDLSRINHISTIYNNVTSNIEVTFSESLDNFLINILNNLVIIIFFNGKVQSEVYVVSPNNFHRCSFGVTNPPTINDDDRSGYSIGSKVITINNEIFVCTNNTKSNAVWVKLQTLT